MKYSFNHGYGMLQAIAMANSIQTFGRFLIVCPSTDSNYDRIAQLFPPDRDGYVRLYNTLAAAYAAATTNNNDVIIMAANDVHTVATGFVWSKSRIHVIGLDSGSRLTDQGTKIVSSASDATGYLLSVTGIRNTFRNIKFIQASTNAAALTVVQMSGEGNLYKNCSFIFQVSTNLNSTSASEVVCGEDSGTFEDCEFGSDTLVTSAARQVMLVKTLTTEMKSCRFRRCAFKISSSSATATFIRLNTISDILFCTMFEDCTFQASIDTPGGIALTAGAIQTGTGVVKGTLNFYYPGFFNVGGALAASGNNVGVQVVAPASVTTAIKGIIPTA